MPLSLVLDGANRHDTRQLDDTLANYVLTLDQRGNHLCGDKGYDSKEVIESIEALKMIPHIRSRGEEVKQKKKGKSPKRWAVERTMSWMNQYRRLKVRWEKKAKNYEAFCHLAFAMMAFRQTEVLG